MQDQLTQLAYRMGSVDLHSCTEAQLSGLIRELNRGRQRIDGFLAQVATEIQNREARGTGAPSGDLFRQRGQVSRNEADRLASRGRVASDFPRAAERMHCGEALTENIDALARLIPKLSDDERARLAAFDCDLADRASSLPPETFSRWLAKTGRAVRDGDRPSNAEEQRLGARLNMGRRGSGMWWLTAEFDSERGAELHAAITAAARDLVSTSDPSGGRADDGQGADRDRSASDLSDQRSFSSHTRAEALHHLATRLPDDSGHQARLGIGYVIDAKTLLDGPHGATVAETWAGQDHDAEAVRRLACDADWYAVSVDGLGHPDATGRTRRAASRQQRLALRALYRGCPLDGTPFDRCEIHHVNVAFENGGQTVLDNLVPISIDWHHRIHDGGWTLAMDPNRALRLSRPDGSFERGIPPPSPLTRQLE